MRYVTPFLLAMLAAGLLAAGAFVAGCRSGAPPSQDVTTDQVALETPSGATAYTPTLEGPLRVLSATPSGTLQRMPATPQPVTVTFSRPMVPLGEAPTPPDSTLTLRPDRNGAAPVAGTMRWEGTQTLVFTPEAPLPPATPFRATLRPLVESQSGETIDAAYSWTFETPRPRLLSSAPADGANFVAPDSAIRLSFSQPVDAAAARPDIAFGVPYEPGRLRGRGFRLANDGDSTLVLRPGRPLEKGQRYRLVLREGLPTTAGPLGLAEQMSLAFRVHPTLALTEVDQSGRYGDEPFTPDRGVTLSFSTPVRFEAVRKAVSFQPAADWPAGIEARDAEVSTTHTLPVTLDPETAYTLTVDSLTDRFGQTLSRATRSLRTGAYEPSLSMEEGLPVIEARQAPVLPLRTTNVEAVQVGMEALAPDALVPTLSAYSGRYDRDGPDHMPVPTDRTWTLDLPRNERRLVPVRLDSMLSAAGTGLVGVHLSWRPPGASEPQSYEALAQVTNLGLTAKFSPHQNTVLVTDLASATPVEGASVTLRSADNTVQWTGTTNAEGRATMPGWAALDLEKPNAYSNPTQFVVVEHEGDVAFTSSEQDDGVEPYRFGLNYDWSPDPRTDAGTVFTDRGLYKTGETVHFKGIVRTKTDSDWQAIADSVRFLIRNPRDELVADRRLAASALGTFDGTWTAPASAAQGRYEMRVARLADATATDDRLWRRGGIATGSFRVDAFRRASFSVTASAAADAYVAGDFFEGRLQARYLFGAGMAGQPARYELTQDATRFDPPGYDGYRFGPLDGSVYDETLLRGEGTLDSTSQASARTQLPGNADGTPATLTWRGTVTAPSQQTITGRATAMLHPGRFYVGLKPSTSFLDLSQDSVLTVDVMSIDPGGQPVGDKEITVELVRREWDSVRGIGADGRYRWDSAPRETVVRRTTITTTAGEATRLRMVVPQGGQYLIRAEAQDVRGNAIRTATSFYAAGGGYVGWQRDNDDRIDLVPEATDYAPGETARIMVPSPYESATALITVEREGILSSRVRTLEGSTPMIRVPLGEEHVPNVYVSVILLNGRTAPPQRTSDPGAPSFKIGYTSLRVDPGARHLQVQVDPRQDTYRPGEQVTADLRLQDASGRGVQGEIAFSAADAGVLNLIDYALPDPFGTFYGPRPLGVTTSETRAALVEQRSYGQKAEDPGGGGGQASDAMRTDFRPLADWAPAIQTGSDGRATVTFTVPERLTTFRLMATAATADHQFGQGQADITVTQPLVLDPALPRFARRGDTFEAGVLVSNRTGRAGTATVRASADGLTLDGPAEQTVSLAAGATKEVRFDWSASTADTAAVRFRASLNDATDALETTLPVQRPTVKEVSATFASTEGATEEALRLPADRVAGLGALDIQLASTALVGLDGAVEHLFEYPYGCLEQRTSRVRPLLIGADLIERFGLKTPGGSRTEALQDWTEQLDAYWVGDGFAMWTGAQSANPYVTAYVVLALAEAQAAGVDVPQPLTGRAVGALADQVRNRSARPAFYSDAVWADTRALMLHALARHDRVLTSELDAFASDPPASPDALSHLLRALVAADVPALNDYRPALADRLRQQIRVEATQAYLQAPSGRDHGWIFTSDARATAFGLSALLAETATRSDSAQAAFQPLAERMVRYLMAERQNGHWASTQDNAAVVHAFQAYADAYEAATPDFAAEVTMAGRAVLSAAFRQAGLSVETTSVPMASLPSERTLPLGLQKDGTGRLYYALRLQTYTSGPVDARSQGLSVERRLQRLTSRGEPTGPSLTTGNRTITLAPGDLVRVTLRLTSPTDRNYVVVDDALPAGLEPVNAAFATVDQGVLDAADTGRGQWWGSFNHTEMKDDRVLLFADYLRQGEHTYTYVARATTRGTFTHPPAEAEMMYQPETRGRTATGTLTVAPAATAAK